MAKVTYSPSDDQIAEGDLPKETKQFGYDFVAGKPVEVTSTAHLHKFSGHPYFEVSGALPKEPVVRTAAERESASLGQGSAEITTGAAAPVAVAPVPDQPERGPAPVTPGQADAPDGDSGLRAVHRGRGVYAVMQGDKDEEVLGGLTKADAEQFNALDAEQKAEFVAAAPTE